MGAHKPKLLCNIFTVSNEAEHRQQVAQQGEKGADISLPPPDHRKEVSPYPPGKTAFYVTVAGSTTSRAGLPWAGSIRAPVP